MKEAHKARVPPRLACAQATAHCFLLWAIPLCDLAALLHQLCGWKKKNGSLHCDKRTFTENTAVKTSLSFNGLKCPEEAWTCSKWMPETDRLTKQHKLHQQPTRDTFQDSIRQKEVTKSPWWRRHEALGGKRLFSTLLTLIETLERPVSQPRNRTLQQKTQE